MSKHTKPWTFEPFELHEQPTWVVYDPNLAVDVAVFYTKRDAKKYLKKVNKRQARRAAAKPVVW